MRRLRVVPPNPVTHGEEERAEQLRQLRQACAERLLEREHADRDTAVEAMSRTIAAEQRAAEARAAQARTATAVETAREEEQDARRKAEQVPPSATSPPGCRCRPGS